jgi:thioredoxin
MSEHVVNASDDNFDTIINQEAPVVVDFWAAWCVPCRMISPILEEVAEERAGGVVIAKLNVDENPKSASRFGVMSIPTLIRFDRGREVSRVVGALPKTQLLKRLGL